jgi:hypothetical protein
MGMTVIEVFADVACPFTHVGLRRFVDRRAELGRHDVSVDLTDSRRVLEDHAEGLARGVVGSPHFFTPAGGFFCPSLDVHRDAGGHLRITADTASFDRFVATCFD